MYTFDPYKLIKQLLPPLLRTPMRIAWLTAVLTPFTRAWEEYVAWRADRYYEVHVTAQTISIEAYLNRLFDPINRRIRIKHGEDEGVYLSLRSEGYDDNFYIDGENGTFIGLDGEMNSEVLFGFTVEIPEGIDTVQVEGVVRSIKAAGVPFEVIIVNI